MELVNAYQLAMKVDAERLARTRINSLDAYLERLLPIPSDAGNTTRKHVEERRETIRSLTNVDDLANHRGTAWAAVNAVAEYVTHAEPARKHERWKEARFERLVITGKSLLSSPELKWTKPPETYSAKSPE